MRGEVLAESVWNWPVGFIAQESGRIEGGKVFEDDRKIWPCLRKIEWMGDRYRSHVAFLVVLKFYRGLYTQFGKLVYCFIDRQMQFLGTNEELNRHSYVLAAQEPSLWSGENTPGLVLS
jgi:hypothetical protein